MVGEENHAKGDHRHGHDDGDQPSGTQATSLPLISVTRRGSLLWRRAVPLWRRGNVPLPLPRVYSLGVQLAPPATVLGVFLFLVLFRFLLSHPLRLHAPRSVPLHTSTVRR